MTTTGIIGPHSGNGTPGTVVHSLGSNTVSIDTRATVIVAATPSFLLGSIDTPVMQGTTDPSTMEGSTAPIRLIGGIDDG